MGKFTLEENDLRRKPEGLTSEEYQALLREKNKRLRKDAMPLVVKIILLFPLFMIFAMIVGMIYAFREGVE